MTPLLSVRNLGVEFPLVHERIRAVNGIDFDLAAGEILGIAGESGCGKSATLLSVLGLLPAPGRVDSVSEVLFDGRNLARLPEAELDKIRGDRIGIVFQEPSASFNPLFTVGAQLAETVRVHTGADKKAAWERACALLADVRIPAAAARVRDYPFQFSGGMLQRAMIALAIANNPTLLLADEPTTALDPTTQRQILSLLKEERDRRGMAIIFVTHDLELLEGFASRILVMYAGDVVEDAPAADLLFKPRHPYTRDLISSIPQPGMFKDGAELYTIPGRVPRPGARPLGCPYHPRCSKAFAKCREDFPRIFEAAGTRTRCWLYE